VSYALSCRPGGRFILGGAGGCVGQEAAAALDPAAGASNV